MSELQQPGGISIEQSTHSAMQAGVGNKRFYKRVPSALQSAESPAWIVQEPILGLFTLFQKPATALSVCVPVVVVGASSDTSHCIGQWYVEILNALFIKYPALFDRVCPSHSLRCSRSQA